MKRLRIILVFMLIVVALHAADGYGIETDSLHTLFPSEIKPKTTLFNAPYAKFIIPVTCITYGALAQISKPLRRIDENLDKEVSRYFTKRRRFDDYLQFAPLTAAYGLDVMGVKAKNNFRDRTFVALTSHVIMGGLVHTVKATTGIKRPDGSNYHSFPSGHTACAFTGAHIFFKEYKDVTPWIGVVGYAAATTVGTMRILNRKHWMSDVVVGAGVGILCVEVSYLLLPVFHKIIGVEQSQPKLVIAPVIRNNHYGLGMAYVF